MKTTSNLSRYVSCSFQIWGWDRKEITTHYDIETTGAGACQHLCVFYNFCKKMVSSPCAESEIDYLKSYKLYIQNIYLNKLWIVLASQRKKYSLHFLFRRVSKKGTRTLHVMLIFLTIRKSALNTSSVRSFYIKNYQLCNGSW